MVNCQRCGKCCIIEGVPCRYLIKLPNGRTICRIYKQRARDNWYPFKIRKGVYCVKVGTRGTKCLN